MNPERLALEMVRHAGEDLPRLRTEMARGGVLGVLVSYHGSRKADHGQWTALGLCQCGKCADLRMFGQDPDYLLLGRQDGRQLRHVRPESVSGCPDEGAALQGSAGERGRAWRSR